MKVVDIPRQPFNWFTVVRRNPPPNSRTSHEVFRAADMPLLLYALKNAAQGKSTQFVVKLFYYSDLQ